MAVQVINIGNVANDGTGDDLREAFIKVNANFEELDLRDDEQTTVTNLGSTGEGIYANKINYDLQFKKLVGGTKITLASDENTITFNADVGLDTLTVSGDTGSVELDDVDTLAINGGEGITTAVSGNTLTITNDFVSELSEDLTPQLGGNLDGQGNDLLNIGDINAGTVTGAFTGNLTGLVHGYDMRDWAEWNTGFDFGGVDNNYASIIDFIVGNTDVDLGSFSSPAAGNIDLGSI